MTHSARPSGTWQNGQHAPGPRQARDGHERHAPGVVARVPDAVVALAVELPASLPPDAGSRTPASCRGSPRGRRTRSSRRASVSPPSVATSTGRSKVAQLRTVHGVRTTRTRRRRPRPRAGRPARAAAAAAAASGSRSSASPRVSAATPATTPSRAARPVPGGSAGARGQQRRRGQHAVERLGHERAVRGDRGPGRPPRARPRAGPARSPASRRPSRPSSGSPRRPSACPAAASRRARQPQLRQPGQRERIQRRPLGRGDGEMPWPSTRPGRRTRSPCQSSPRPCSTPRR